MRPTLLSLIILLNKMETPFKNIILNIPYLYFKLSQKLKHIATVIVYHSMISKVGVQTYASLLTWTCMFCKLTYDPIWSWILDVNVKQSILTKSKKVNRKGLKERFTQHHIIFYHFFLLGSLFLGRTWISCKSGL